MSARKSSTVYPFSYHPSEKAENSISVRSAFPSYAFFVRWPRTVSKGRLFIFILTISAQKPITRHLVVSARPARPARPEDACEAPKREAYPDEVLTHRFRPYGDPGDLPREDHMDVDVVEVSPKEKKLKRKGGAETGLSRKRKAKLAAS
jgi:hypothetical protein